MSPSESTSSQRSALFRPEIKHLPRIAPILLPIISIATTTLGFSFRIDRVPSFDNLVWVLYGLLASGILPVGIVIGVGLMVADVANEKLRPLWLSLLAITSVAAFVLGLVFGPMLDF